MALTTFKSIVKSRGGIKVEGDTRGFKVIFDEPMELGGTNEGMNPVEMQLNTLGACQIITAKVHAPRFGVQIDDMWVEVEGDLDLRGFQGVPGVKPGILEIRFVMHFVTDAPENKVKELAKEVERLCPIGNTLTSGVDVKEIRVVVEKMIKS